MRKEIIFSVSYLMMSVVCLYGCQKPLKETAEFIEVSEHEPLQQETEMEIDYIYEAGNRIWGQKSKVPESGDAFDAEFMQQYYAAYWLADSGHLLTNKSVVVYGIVYQSEVVNSFNVEDGAYIRANLLMIPSGGGKVDLFIEKDGECIWEKNDLEKGEEFYLYADDTEAGTYTLKWNWSEAEGKQAGIDPVPYINMTVFEIDETDAEQYEGGEDIG